MSRKASDAGPVTMVFDEVDQLYELIEDIDPRITLIAVEARSAHLMRVDKPSPVVLFDDYVRRREVGRIRSVSADALDA